MSRYIDADEVLTQKKPLEFNSPFEQGKVYGWNKAIEYVGNFAPTADVRENVHAEWLYLYDGNYKCSNCGSWWTCVDEEIENDLKFCPNCGADMKNGGMNE